MVIGTVPRCGSKRGIQPQSPSQILNDLKGYMKKTFGVTLFNFTVDQPNDDFIKENRYRLLLFLSSRADFLKMHYMHKRQFAYNANKQKQIANKFCSLVKNQSFCDVDILENLFVAYIDFNFEIRCAVTKKASEKTIPFLTEKYKESRITSIFFHFDSLFLLFKSTNQVKKYLSCDCLINLKEDYLSFIKEFDEFDVFTFKNTKITLISQETLDRDYHGSLTFYIDQI